MGGINRPLIWGNEFLFDGNWYLVWKGIKTLPRRNVEYRDRALTWGFRKPQHGIRIPTTREFGLGAGWDSEARDRAFRPSLMNQWLQS